ncbi:MAG: hypothetical protein ACR2FN_06195 [Chitinophagaceae bacterium]
MEAIENNSSSYGVSGIKNADDLQAEIRRIKAGLVIQEFELKERLKHAPQQALKAGVTKVLPAFISKKVLFTSWLVIRQGLALMKGFKKIAPKNKETFGHRLVNSVKDLGLKTALRVGYAFWKKHSNK